MKLPTVLAVGMIGLMASAAIYADVITVRGDAWCPYNCDVGANPGYGIEIMQEVFKAAGHTVDYQIEPWNRALANVKSGKEISAIGANEKDAKDNGLVSGKIGIGASDNCVFVPKASSAKFSKPDDLAQFKKIGIITGYTYNDAIDAWLNTPPNKSKLDAVAGDSAVATNAKKVAASRIEAVIEDSSVMGYTLKDLKLEDQVKVAGCTKAEKIYVAFSPANPKTPEYVKILDDGIVSMRKSGKLKTILAKYGAKDWK